MRVLVTGAAGFICGYLIPELLERGHDVVGVDNFSKYGRIAKSYDDHPRYRFVEGDAKDAALLTELAADCSQVVAAAERRGVGRAPRYRHQQRGRAVRSTLRPKTGRSRVPRMLPAKADGSHSHPCRLPEAIPLK